MHNENIIPEMTDPLGKYWTQPPLSMIEIYTNCALMSVHAMVALADYSATIPSGVYPGKMWRAKLAPPHYQKRKQRRWYLRWYGPEINGRCTIYERKIFLRD